MARFYQIADGQPWNPSGVITDINGVKRSVDNVLSIYTDEEIEKLFNVKIPVWEPVPEDKMISEEQIVSDGKGGLSFSREFVDKPNPTPAEIFTELSARVKQENKDKLYSYLNEITFGQYTREDLENRIKDLSAADKVAIANLFPTLTRADLP